MIDYLIKRKNLFFKRYIFPELKKRLELLRKIRNDYKFKKEHDIVVYPKCHKKYCLRVSDDQPDACHYLKCINCGYESGWF